MLRDKQKELTIKELLDRGVHFGHQVQKWNPKMKPYVFGERGGIHIIDLQKTLPIAHQACQFIKKVASQGKHILFVGTKKQAVEVIQATAQKCEQFYVTKRWLGGTMTNFKTIKVSIDRLRKLEIMKEKGEFQHFGKKERVHIEKQLLRLQEYLSGIREMKGIPSALFVVDVKKEHIAVLEARKLNIPVVAIADTNIDPTLVDFPIPGNDDSIRSIKLFADMVADAYLEGQEEFKNKQQITVEDMDRQEKQVSSSITKTKKEVEEQQGPDVVRVSKRKLVAAGTADEVELDLELTQEQAKSKEEDQGQTQAEGLKKQTKNLEKSKK